jgi:hypothetical protein
MTESVTSCAKNVLTDLLLIAWRRVALKDYCNFSGIRYKPLQTLVFKDLPEKVKGEQNRLLPHWLCTLPREALAKLHVSNSLTYAPIRARKQPFSPKPHFLMKCPVFDQVCRRLRPCLLDFRLKLAG